MQKYKFKHISLCLIISFVFHILSMTKTQQLNKLRLSILLVCLFYTILPLKSIAIDSYVDSLIYKLEKTTIDTAKFQLLNDLSDNAADGEWEKYNEQLGLLSKSLINNSNKEISKLAKKYYAIYLNNKGYEYAGKADYVKSLEYYADCIKLFEEIGNEKGAALAFSSIGAIYDRLDEVDKALENYKLAMIVWEKYPTDKNIVATLNNIAVIYGRKKLYGIQYSYFLRGYNISKKYNFRNQIVTQIYNGIGTYWWRKKHKNYALYFYQNGIKMSEEIGDRSGLATNLVDLAELYYDLNEYDKAMVLAERSLQVAKAVDYPMLINQSANVLAKIYKAKGNYKLALECRELAIESKEIYNRIDNQKSVIRFQYKSEFDKKEIVSKKEIQKQKILRNGSLGLLAVVLVFAYIFFNQRNKIKKGKILSDNLLLNILPSEVANELKEKGEVNAQYFDEVSVIFTDFVNFTGISETLTPKELVAEIHEYFKGFDAIITSHGLEKIKTIGDAYLAVSGLPNANHQHAKNVMLAAIEIVDFVKSKKENGGLFDIRIGIHSGSLVAGVVGVKKFAYDIWGDTVNTAARMEQNSESGKINVSESTFQLVKNDFEFEYRGKVMAKNKGEIDMYYLINK